MALGRCRWLLLTLGFVSVAARGVAQPAESQVLMLAFSAPDECGQARTFEAEVRARTERVRFEAAGQPTTVTIARSLTGYVGRLDLAAGQSRELASSSCQEVLAGLALALVFALDPNSLTSVPAPVRTVSPSPSPLASTRQRSRLSPKHPIFLGVSANFSTALLPMPVLGGGLTLDRLSAWWALHLSVDYARGAARASQVAKWHFSSWSAAAAVCPRLGQSGPWRLEVCSGLAAGFLLANGTLSGSAVQVARARPMLALVAGARLGFNWRFLRLTLELVDEVPLQRDAFVVVDASGRDYEVFRAPEVGVGARLGVSMPISGTGFGEP